MEESHNSTPLTAKMMQFYLDDMEDYERELLDLQESLEKATEPVRQYLLDKNMIAKMEVDDVSLNLGAVDSSSHSISIGEISTVLMLSVYYHVENQPRYESLRKTAPQTQAFSRMERYTRLYGELKLLADVDSYTIADGSWWSFLMDSNMFITQYDGMRENKEYFQEMHDECFKGDNPLIIRALKNTNIISMSKTGTSKAFSKRRDLSEYFTYPVSDLALFSSVLRENEYLVPMPLNKGTDGNFGIEQRGWTKSNREVIRKYFREELYVTFYKAWGYKKAYRIEFNKNAFSSEEDFNVLLNIIRRDTSFPTQIEPEPQMWADRLAKQVHEAALLYSEMRRAKFDDIMFQTRS